METTFSESEIILKRFGWTLWSRPNKGENVWRFVVKGKLVWEMPESEALKTLSTFKSKYSKQLKGA